MAIKTIRTTGNRKDDLFLFQDEAQLAREKYHRLREEGNRRNGVPTFSQDLASVFVVAAVALALHNDYHVKIKNLFLTVVGANTTNRCNALGPERAIKDVENAGFVVKCADASLQ